jgi:hypothetical protein
VKEEKNTVPEKEDGQTSVQKDEHCITVRICTKQAEVCTPLHIVSK